MAELLTWVLVGAAALAALAAPVVYLVLRRRRPALAGWGTRLALQAAFTFLAGFTLADSLAPSSGGIASPERQGLIAGALAVGLVLNAARFVAAWRAG